MLKKGKTLIEAVATLMGITIGAGILGIPYALRTVGFGIGTALMIGVSVIVIILELMYAELILRTKTQHEIPGYAGLYLGSKTKGLSVVFGLIGGYGALLAYLIGQGQIMEGILGGSSFIWVLVYFVVTGYLVYRGIDVIKDVETLLEIIVVLVIIFLVGYASSYIQLDNLTFMSTKNVFAPYGVLYFAFTGLSAIPQLNIELKGRENLLPKAIVSANLAVLIIYIVFNALVIGVLGQNVTEVATVGLGQKVGPLMLIIGNVLAFFTITTSYLITAMSMRKLFENDFNLSVKKSIIVTLGVPLLLFLLGARDFVKILGLVGGVILGSQGIILIFAFWKARINGDRKPEFTIGLLGKLGLLLITILLLGMVFSLRI